MSNVDLAILDVVMAESPAEVKRSTLEHAIILINEAYTKALLTDEKADFEAIRNKVLDYCDLWDLFLFKPYKSALGKYYVRRRLKEEKEGFEVGAVYEADANYVLVAASRNVKILFRSDNSSGKLSFSNVDTGKTRFARKGKSTRVPEEQYLKAKRKALAAMNSRRE